VSACGLAFAMFGGPGFEGPDRSFATFRAGVVRDLRGVGSQKYGPSAVV